MSLLHSRPYRSTRRQIHLWAQRRTRSPPRLGIRPEQSQSIFHHFLFPDKVRFLLTWLCNRAITGDQRSPLYNPPATRRQIHAGAQPIPESTTHHRHQHYHHHHHHQTVTRPDTPLWRHRSVVATSIRRITGCRRNTGMRMGCCGRRAQGHSCMPRRLRPRLRASCDRAARPRHTTKSLTSDTSASTAGRNSTGPAVSR